MTARPLLCLVFLGACTIRLGFSDYDVVLRDSTCANPPCEDTWRGVDNSDLGSWGNVIEFGSGSGPGITSNFLTASQPTVIVDSAGRPIVAFAGRDSNATTSTIYVLRWSGTQWTEVGSGSASGGGVSQNTDHASAPALAKGPGANNYWLAWAEQAGDIYVRHYNGTAWVEVAGSGTAGGISNNISNSSDPAIAVDSQNGPTVTWRDTGGGGFETFAKRFDGTAWVELGGSASAGGISNNGGIGQEPIVVIDSADAPIVAWVDGGSGNGFIYVRRWDGNTWAEMGAGSGSGSGIGDGPGSSVQPAITLDASGAPVIAWREFLGADTGHVYARRWDGSAWQALGGSASGNGISENGAATGQLAVALGPSGIVVAWPDGASRDIYARRFDGTAWPEILPGAASDGGISNNAGNSIGPSLAFGNDGVGYLAWQDDLTGSTQVYLRVVDSTGTSELGPPGPFTGGISNSPTSSRLPALSFSDAGYPTVVWVENNGANAVLYAKTHSPAGWQEVATGSASGNGLAAVPFIADAPSMLATGQGAPVIAWPSSTSEIYVGAQQAGVRGEWSLGSASGVGISNAGGATCWDPHLARGSDGTLIAAWLADGNVWVRQFDGSSWVEVGTNSASGTGISGPNLGANLDLAVDANNQPIVAWSSNSGSGLFVRRFANGNWDELNGSATLAGIGFGNNDREPALAVDALGQPYVAWRSAPSGSAQIFSRYFDGATWSAPSQVSQAGGSASSPSIAVDEGNRPLVAWQDDTTGNLEIYAARYEDNTWLGFGSSASSGGISRSAGPSREPSIAVFSATVCVAWSELAGSGFEIVMRCADWP